MDYLRDAVYAVMLLSAIGIVVLVLLQHGKGADMGTGFGAGASGSLFGATGSANFLSRMTAILAATFFVCTFALSWFASHQPQSSTSNANLPGRIAPAPATGPLPAPVAPASSSAAPAKNGEIPQ